MSTGCQKEKQSGEKDGAKDNPKEVMLHIKRKVMEKEREANREKEKVKESVITVESQDTGRESAQSPKGSSMHAITVVKRVIKQRSVSSPKEEEKGKEFMR